MGRRSPRPAAAGIRIARERIAPRTTLAAVQAVWAEALGERIAAVAEPVAERNGVVAVSCESAVWAEELNLMQDRLLAALRDRLPESAPGGLRFEARR